MLIYKKCGCKNKFEVVFDIRQNIVDECIVKLYPAADPLKMQSRYSIRKNE